MTCEKIDLKIPPYKFQPYLNHRFVVDIEEIDGFLIKKFERGPWENKLFQKKKLICEIHSCIAPSGEQQLREWMYASSFIEKCKFLLRTPVSSWKNILQYKKYRNIVLKYLDPVGQVTQKIEFKNVKLEKVHFTPLDYDDNAATRLVSLCFEMSYRNEILHY